MNFCTKFSNSQSIDQTLNTTPTDRSNMIQSRPQMDPKMSTADQFDKIIAEHKAVQQEFFQHPNTENKENEDSEQENGQNKVDLNMSQNRKRGRSSSNKENDQQKESKKMKCLLPGNDGKPLSAEPSNDDVMKMVRKVCEPPARIYKPAQAYGPAYLHMEPDVPDHE